MRICIARPGFAPLSTAIRPRFLIARLFRIGTRLFGASCGSAGRSVSEAAHLTMGGLPLPIVFSLSIDVFGVWGEGARGCKCVV